MADIIPFHVGKLYLDEVEVGDALGVSVEETKEISEVMGGKTRPVATFVKKEDTSGKIDMLRYDGSLIAKILGATVTPTSTFDTGEGATTVTGNVAAVTTREPGEPVYFELRLFNDTPGMGGSFGILYYRIVIPKLSIGLKVGESTELGVDFKAYPNAAGKVSDYFYV
jgi:hypothetical protein